MWHHLVVVAVVAHFFFGFVAVLTERNHLFKIAPLRWGALLYSYLHFEQKWDMFAPPPRDADTIQYSLHLPTGWTELIDIGAPYFIQQKNRLTMPRGLSRIVAFYRASAEDARPERFNGWNLRSFYYQQLADYFCRGDGKISGLRGIAFYHVVVGLPDFFEKDELGQPLPPPSSFDARQRIYMESCERS
jgi:hypothetical protein